MDHIDFANIIKNIENRRKRIRYSFQELALLFATKLNDKKNLPLYMRLCKYEDKEVLMRAFSLAMDSNSASSKGPLFLWYLKKIKKRTKYRIFIGIFPNDEQLDINGVFEDISVPQDCQIHKISKNHLHITLLFFNDLPGEYYSMLSKSVYAMVQKYGVNVEISAKSLTLNNKYVWLTDFNAEVYRYHYGIKKMLQEKRKVVHLFDKRKFFPHITLARLKCKLTSKLMEQKIALREKIQFTGNFALVKTRLTKNGSEYTIHRFD